MPVSPPRTRKSSGQDDLLQATNEQLQRAAEAIRALKEESRSTRKELERERDAARAERDSLRERLAAADAELLEEQRRSSELSAELDGVSRALEHQRERLEELRAERGVESVSEWDDDAGAPDDDPASPERVPPEGRARLRELEQALELERRRVRSMESTVATALLQADELTVELEETKNALKAALEAKEEEPDS